MEKTWGVRAGCVWGVCVLSREEKGERERNRTVKKDIKRKRKREDVCFVGSVFM